MKGIVSASHPFFEVIMLKKCLTVLLLCSFSAQLAFAGDYACFRCEKPTRRGFQGVDATRTITTCDIHRVYTLQSQHYHCIKQQLNQ